MFWIGCTQTDTTFPFAVVQGEISLRGRVTAVGGIKEKLIGALRAGVKTVLLPAQNRKDVKDLPQEVKDGLEIIHVRYVHTPRPICYQPSTFSLSGFTCYPFQSLFLFTPGGFLCSATLVTTCVMSALA